MVTIQSESETLNFASILDALHSLLNPQLDHTHALDLAFYLTVLDLTDYKFSVRQEQTSTLFAPEFKLYLINAKLKHIGKCPQATDDPTSRIFACFYIALAGTLFQDLDDAVDAELHSLIKCVPKIIAGNQLTISSAEVDAFIAEETASCSLE